MNKKWVTIGVLGVLVLGGGYWGYKHFTAKPAVSSFLTAKAVMGNVSKVITATGTVNFPQSIPLTFQQNGEITAINVQPGDSVKAGEVLAKTNDSSLQLAVAQQQASLNSAEAQLQTLQDSYNAQTLAQAQAGVASAEQQVATSQQALTTAQQNADPNYLANQVALAKLNLQQASNDYAKAQLSGSASTSALTAAQTALTTAENAQNGGAAQALAAAEAAYHSAQASLVSAKAQLTQQEQGPPAANIQSDQAAITNAQVQLETAQKNLANAEIIAPVDGVVVSSTLQLYQQSDSTSIITITPSQKTLEVDASIDQADIDQIKTGQKVDITLDSAPNQNIIGTVSSIALQGTIVSNVTTYDVKITVDQPTTLLRAGMNANVSIIIDQVNNVLTVPSAAVITRGTQSFVREPLAPGAAGSSQGTGGSRQGSSGQRSSGGQGYGGNQSGQSGSNPYRSGSSARSGMAAMSARFVPVVTGLDDGTNVEIKSGLKAGQEVIIGTRSTTTTTTNTNRGGFGGGANPGRAMHQLGG